MLYASCSMLFAPCSLLYAPCTTLNARPEAGFFICTLFITFTSYSFKKITILWLLI
jgi:hypothetical protein